jgi:FG-GAP-like repeat
LPPITRRRFAAGLTAVTAHAWFDAAAAQPPNRRLGDPDVLPAASGTPRYRHPPHDKPLPDGRVAQGTGSISAAWFSDPTQRYRHFALGTEHEAASLVIALRDRRVLKFTLPADSVFEDREPRLVNVDGTDMVIAVRSYLKYGAALALLAVGANGIEIVAETTPIGMPFRWLNPAGAADFDGDGILDLALVLTPHIGGVLQVWTARGGKLVQTYELDDVSNHVVRSAHLSLSAVADFNGDGRPDLAIPSQDRRRLRFLSFAQGRVTEFASVDLLAPASENFTLVIKGGRPAVQVGIGGGRTQVVQPLA